MKEFIKTVLFVLALCGTVILHSVPIVLYYSTMFTIKPPAAVTKQQDMTPKNKTLDNQTSSCTSAIPWGISIATNGTTDVVCEPYSGEVCLPYLKQWQECIPLPRTPPLGDDAGSHRMMIVIDGRVKNQVKREQDILQVQQLLEISGFSDCLELAIPVLCHYYFPLMDAADCSSQHQQPVALTSSPAVYTVTQEVCNDVDNTVCATPWALANSIESFRDSLPDCSSLPHNTNGNINQLMNDSSAALIEYKTNTSSSSLNITCRDDFILINQACVPRCDQFRDHPYQITQTRSTLLYIGAGIAVLFSVISFILSVINRQTMFRFPSFFLVIFVVAVFIGAMTILIQAFDFTDHRTLMCSSVNLYEALASPTPYCKYISGVVFHYAFANLIAWWFLHLCVFFYEIKFPFHAKRMRRLNRTKKIAVVLVIIGFIFPIPGVIAAYSHKYGYGIYSFPPKGCLPYVEIWFYSVVVMFCLAGCIGVCLLISIFWIIHKNQTSDSSGNRITSLTTAEKKLITAMMCYVVFGTYTMILFGLTGGNTDQLFNGFTEYFLCELNGHVPGKCDRNVFERYLYPEMTAIGYIIFPLVPMGVLIFIVNWSKLWKSIKDWFKSIQQPSTSSMVTKHNSSLQ